MEKYKLIKQIRQGPKGEVWIVKGTYSQKQYVLKQINLQHVSKRVQQAAHLEVKLLSTLNHPNIVSYMDSFYNSKGSLFIVMGYCENGDLYSQIRNRNEVSFSEKQITEWLIQICMALKYLHDRNILHRDLKTQNIFLTRCKIIKIGDFGIARVLDSTSDMASTLIGTPYYMSPEIFCNKPYNHKSDIWALGCCVYEMASLKHAFNAKNLNSLIRKILQGKVSKLSEQYSKDFLEILASMLSHNQEDRPSVTEILLSSYIRSHIVKFLEETKPSSKIGHQKCNKLIRRATGNYNAVGIHFKNNGKLISEDVLLSKGKASEKRKSEKSNTHAKETTVAIPDINGNGDGNDNSQYKFNDNEEQEFSKGIQDETSKINQKICFNKITCSHELHGKMQALNTVKNGINFNFQKINASNNDGQNLRSQNKNTTKSYHSNQLKYANNDKNGQISLKFLENLACTIMKTSRFSNSQLSEASAKKNGISIIDAHIPTQPCLSLDHKNNKTTRYPKILYEERSKAMQYNESKNIVPNLFDWQVTKNSKNDLDQECGKTIFPKVSHHPFPIFNDDNCSVKSNNIDGCLIQQIITCGIQKSNSKTLCPQLNLSALQQRIEHPCEGAIPSLSNSEYGKESRLANGINFQSVINSDQITSLAI